MSKYTLRDYQVKGVDLISKRFAVGDKKVMLWAMTGAGKGLWMAWFVNESISKKIHTLTVIKRRELIFQTSKNYEKYYNIKSSILMGNSSGFNGSHLSQICSIDTIVRRIESGKYDFLKSFGLIIIDECHDMVAPGYKKLIWWLEGYSLKDFSDKAFENIKCSFKKYYVGLTATPFRVGKRTHTYWDSVVKPIEAHELRDTGSLVPVKIYQPSVIDTSGIRIVGDDFDQKVLFERATKSQIVGDIVETYKQYGNEKPAICFTVNKEHSKIMAESFRQAGISAIHCDADHSKKEREDAIAGAKSGKYKIITNCNIWSVGFDAPFIEIEINARPTDSEILCIQQWGRVLRPYKICAKCGTEYGGESKCFMCGSSILKYEKTHATIFDHANNTSKWGFPYDVRQPELEAIDIKRKNQQEKSKAKTCKKCFAVIPIQDKICICGFDFESNKSFEINNVDGTLSEVTQSSVKQQTYQKIKDRWNQYVRVSILHNMKDNWKYIQLYNEFGEELFEYSKEYCITPAIKKMLQEGYGRDELHKNFNIKSKVYS